MLTKSDLETNLERVHDWIKAADQKVSIFLAFQGVVFTLLFGSVFSWTSENIRNLSCTNTLILISGIILVAYSIYKSTSAIIPRLAKDKNKNSITYFGDIAKFDLGDFKKAIKETNIDEYEIELVEQIHVSSKIATRKHSQFRDAILIFFAGMILLVISFILFKI
ncbi:MAG: hypothetical protein G01um10143_690 [Parcubacteria group bacterium Gr01-1014_3]|nr:MAG: hypothetical protein G01um10143_690 [Parcubacteria group bacterium Gr01-1014_3]